MPSTQIHTKSFLAHCCAIFLCTWVPGIDIDGHHTKPNIDNRDLSIWAINSSNLGLRGNKVLKSDSLLCSEFVDATSVTKVIHLMGDRAGAHLDL